MTLVNPFLAWPVTQGWTEGPHGKPGGGPAIDYGIPYGTPLQSPDDGRVSLSQGENSGLTVALIRDNGSQIILCHGSDFIVRHGDRVQQLQPLMFSGNSGTVTPAPTKDNPYAGSHLHTYGLTAGGARWNWTLDAGVPAGGGDEPFPTPEDVIKGDSMYIIKATQDAVILAGGKPVVRKDDQLFYTPGQPIKVLSSQEAALVAHFQKDAPVPFTLWGRSDIEKLIRSNGLIETFDYEPGGIPSGRIRYSATQTAYPTVELKP